MLEEAARKWRDDQTNLTWLPETPMIEYQREYNKRLPYPLDWDEQKLHFSELAVHLRTMALFDANTGLRDQELCGLEMGLGATQAPDFGFPTADSASV